jgi:hypothetical protein
MPDLSFSPIGDTAAVAALLWTVWRERGSKKAFAVRSLRTDRPKSWDKKNPLLSTKWLEPVRTSDKQKGRP